MSMKTMKIYPARTPDQVHTTSTPPTWRAKDVGGNLPPRTPMGTEPLPWFGRGWRSREERIEAMHTRDLPSFGPQACVKPYCCFVVLYCVLAREHVVLQYTRAAGETECEWPPP